jgi:hypothetical protein
MRILALRSVCALLVTFCSAATLAAQAPGPGSAGMKLSSRSLEARTAFYAGVEAAENQLPAHAERHFVRALEADSAFAIARAFYAAHAPSLTAEQRKHHMQRAAADAMDASVAELLMVLALRAPEGAERRSLLKAAVDAAPDDPHVLYQYAANTADVAERARLLESITRKFPDFAPAYNLLAYAKAREMGDLPGGLTTAERYMHLAHSNPNAHDTYAELLQWSGRLTEAAQHYRQAIAVDSSYRSAHSGLAEIALLQGQGAVARAHYANAMKLTTSQQQRMVLRQAIATSFIVDGNAKAALAELSAIGQLAESQGIRSIAAQSYRNMAVIEAAMGTKTLVDGHLRKADALSTPNSQLQRGFAAAAYALAGDVVAARPLAATFTGAAVSSGSPLLKRQAAALNEIVQYASGQTEPVRAASVTSGSYGALGKVVLADALAKRGRKEEARALMKEVNNYYEVDLFTIIARRRAQRFNN